MFELGFKFETLIKYNLFDKHKHISTYYYFYCQTQQFIGFLILHQSMNSVYSNLMNEYFVT